MEKRLSSIEKRLAKLEKMAVLFEEHRQSWIDLNRKLKSLKDDEIKRNRRLPNN